MRCGIYSVIGGLLLAGCARYGATAQEGLAIHPVPCWAVLVEARTTPPWFFWDRPSKAWVVNKDKTCPVEFIPVDSSSPDLMGEALGPLGGLSQHLVVPVK